MTRRASTPGGSLPIPDASPDAERVEPAAMTTAEAPAATALQQVVGALSDPPLADEMASVEVPMLEEPTHLPGQRRARFSPLAFYALSRIEREEVDVEDEGLWLHEEACPKVTPTGIELGGQKFFHPQVQDLVAGLPTARGHELRIRYNRAHLARGVLQEVIICERDPQGRLIERLRLVPREQALQELDLNLTLREQQRYTQVLLAKVNAANETRIALEHGARAIERLRDEQAARVRRQRREQRPAIVASPIVGESRREAEAREADARTAELAAHLARPQAAQEDDAEHAPAAPRTSEPDGVDPIRSAPNGPGMVSDPDAPDGSSAHKADHRPHRSTPRRTPAPKPKRATKGTQQRPESDAAAPPLTPPTPRAPMQSLIEELGGASGFYTSDDD